jgi:AAA+ superfamily predicted ATPase
MGFPNFIKYALSLPDDLIPYHVGRELAKLYPDRSVVAGSHYNFDLEAFADDERCSIVEEASVFCQVHTNWQAGRKPEEQIENGWLNVLWQGKLLEVVFLTYGRICARRHHWIVADDKATALEFYDAVCEWSCEVRAEIVVYADGYFEKNKELFESIQSATFENLILRGPLKDELQTDFEQFFGARELYERYGIPWKRGAIFTGPPGNGKTHAVKALINQLAKPCIYVRGFKAEYGTEQENISEVFERARATTPCIVVFEDLDSMINNENRAFFLNELDGFEVNTGVVVIATTNHPEKLDAAILERPSRFDRKYQFNLPDEEERRVFIAAWSNRLQTDMRITVNGIGAIVNETNGFSFAYLKELLLSSMVQWVSNERQTTMDAVVEKQAVALRAQMGAPPEKADRRFKFLSRAVTVK